MQRNAKTHLPKPDAAEFQQRWRAIKSSWNLEVANQQFEQLCDRFSENSPTFIAELRKKGQHYLVFLNYPESIRPSLSTTNSVEAINDQLEIKLCAATAAVTFIPRHPASPRNPESLLRRSPWPAAQASSPPASAPSNTRALVDGHATTSSRCPAPPPARPTTAVRSRSWRAGHVDQFVDGQPRLFDQIHHRQQHLSVPAQKLGQLPCVWFPRLDDRVVVSLQGGSPFLSKVCNPTLPRAGLRTAPQPLTYGWDTFPNALSVRKLRGS
jgi:Transposase, Mutator family